VINKKKVKSLSYPSLALIDWLMEKPSLRFVIRDEDWRGHDTNLYEIIDGEAVRVAASLFNEGDPALLDRLGGRVGFDFEPLRQSGVLCMNRPDAAVKDGEVDNGYHAFLKSAGVTVPDSGYNRLHRVVRETRVWWEAEGKAAFQRLREKRDADRAKANRIIVIGIRCTVEPKIDPEKKALLPNGFKLPLPNLRLTRPTYTATVVKETQSRLYIKDVQRIRNGSDGLEPSVIKGREPNQYIEREHVMVDGVASAFPRNIIDVDAERVASFQSACASTLDEVMGPLLNLYDRIFQAEASHADLMQEAIQRDKKV
jgi:hypothetical protein